MEFKLFSNEIEELKALMLNNRWDYHMNKNMREEIIQQRVEEGYYQNDRETFWLIDNDTTIGIICVEDVNDSILSFDLRLDAKYRGKGYGYKALLWLQNYLFGEKGKIRIEGYTRVDNVNMRKCLTKAGFVKEGYLRNAWENEDGSITDCILYSAIHSDWQSKITTPINLDELPF